MDFTQVQGGAVGGLPGVPGSHVHGEEAIALPLEKGPTQGGRPLRKLSALAELW